MVEGSVEREVEARAVADLLERTRDGPAGLVVEGEAGIGKTTLALDAAEMAAAEGFRVLSSHGSPAEANFSCAALADLIDGVGAEALAKLPEKQRVALNRIRIGGDLDGSTGDERVVAHAFSEVIERLAAESAVLLVIDDAQWLDASSRAVIGFAVRRLVKRTAVLVTIRTGDGDDVDHDASWPTMLRADDLTRIRMCPLSLGGVHALIAARFGQTLPRPVITRIYDVSGGNPMFATELAAIAVRDGSFTPTLLPGGLSALVRRRIGDADDEVHAVLLAAACAAAPTVELVSRVTGLPSARVVGLLESAETFGVVVLDGQRVRFIHPLYATGVYANAAPAARRAAHRTLAELVGHPEPRARHLALGAIVGDPAMLDALDAAADASATRGAFAGAAELIDLALDRGGDTTARRIRAAELHFRAGSMASARSHLTTTLDGLPSGSLRALALAHLGAVKAYDDDLTGAIETFRNAIAETEDAPMLRVVCSLRLALALTMADRGGETLDHARRADQLADEHDLPGLRSQALSLWVTASFLRGDGVDGPALQTALDLEDPRSGATTFLRASAADAVISAYTGDLDRARARLDALHRDMVDEGSEVDLVWVANRQVGVAIWSGRYADAAETAEDAVQRAEQLGARFSLATAWTRRADAAAYEGRDADARADAHAAIEVFQAIGARRMVKEPTRVLGFLEVSRADYPAALAVLEPLLEDFDPPRELEIEGGSHLPDAIEALVGLGYLDRADPLVDALERHGSARDRPWMLATGARGRAAVLAARGELPAALRAVEEAMAHHRRLPMPFETARTQVLLGQLQRRTRLRNAAADTLTEALTTFDALGAALWAARARTHLAQLSSPRGDGTQLTAAERRTADLAADGLSNKQIAAELFIAEKTVEMNLSRTYRKLGIRSRAGLSTALRSHDDHDAH